MYNQFIFIFFFFLPSQIFSWNSRIPLPIADIKAIYLDQFESESTTNDQTRNELTRLLQSCMCKLDTRQSIVDLNVVNESLHDSRNQVSKLLDWIVCRFDASSISKEYFPSPTQKQVCSLVHEGRQNESLIFNYRCRWFSIINIYERHLESDENNEERFVWKDLKGNSIVSNIEGMIDVAIDRCENVELSFLISGVKIDFVSREGWKHQS